MQINEISASERHLLETASEALAKSSQPLCADFHEYLETHNHLPTSLLKQYFDQLLLDDHAVILEDINPFTLQQILSLFDQYLACMAIAIPNAIKDTEQSRAMLEALRKRAFSLLQKILAKQDLPQASIQRKLTRKTDIVFEHVMPQEQFVLACNQLLHPENHMAIAILAIQLDFGIHSKNAIQPKLAEIAIKLRHLAGPGSLIAHISTRRWAICLQDVTELAPAVAMVIKLQAEFSHPIIINNLATHINPHVGIALSSHVQKDADFLLHAALKVSNMSSHQRDHYRVYDPELDAESKRLDLLSAQLKSALFNNALDLYYQPKYSYKKNKIIGLETLLRWQQDDGPVSIPLIFQLIERDGMLQPFTKWLLETTFQHLQDFLDRGIDIQLSINILPQNLNQSDFPRILSGLLETWNVPRDRLTIEITEGTLLEDAEDTIETLQAIREMGLKISLDDFGTGYSSLSYLSRLPINEIKVDQAFVRNMFSSERDLAIVRTIIELGNNFHLDLVAEGVEDAATAKKLAELGCDIMQGFWFSKAVSHAELISWFENDDRQHWQRLPKS